MKDLDFDELDRAVNSLMARTATTSAPKDGDEPVVEISPEQAQPSAPPVERQAPATPQGAASGAQDLASNTSRQKEVDSRPTVAPRKSGRFMDVMHESSDMRPSARKLDPPSARPARFSGSTLQPTGADVSSELVVAPAGEPKVADPAPVQQSQASSMPDPIDFAMQSNVEAPGDDTPGDEVGTRPYSPFVPDAKVEKRPLGGAAESTVPSSDQAIEAKELEPDVESQLPAAPDEQLPEELQSDLIAIESSEPATGEGADQASTEATRSDSVGSKASAGSARAATPRIGSESIPNQYATKPKQAGAEAEADIFNTEAFSRPLAHPAKKKSGWLTVLFIFLLVVLGAGLGALVYLYVL